MQKAAVDGCEISSNISIMAISPINQGGTLRGNIQAQYDRYGHINAQCSDMFFLIATRIKVMHHASKAEDLIP